MKKIKNFSNPQGEKKKRPTVHELLGHKLIRDENLCKYTGSDGRNSK